MTNVSARAWRGHRSSDRLPAKVFDDASSAADGTWPAGGEGDLSPLVPAARSGDQEAFRLLYRAVQPLLLRYLRTLVGDDAEDVASEAWLQIARDLGRSRVITTVSVGGLRRSPAIARWIICVACAAGPAP